MLNISAKCDDLNVRCGDLKLRTTIMTNQVMEASSEAAVANSTQISTVDMYGAALEHENITIGYVSYGDSQHMT